LVRKVWWSYRTYVCDLLSYGGYSKTECVHGKPKCASCKVYNENKHRWKKESRKVIKLR